MASPEFKSVAELKAHYRAVNARIFAPVTPKAKPVSNVRVVVVGAEAAAERKRAEKARIAAEAEALWLGVRDDVRAVLHGARGRKSCREIIADAAAEFGLPVSELVGRSRKAYVSAVRQHAMARLKTAVPNLSLPAIGRLFDRDHTTVLHALQRVASGAVKVPRPGCRTDEKRSERRVRSAKRGERMAALHDEGLTYETLAERFGVTVGSVKASIHGARKRLALQEAA